MSYFSILPIFFPLIVSSFVRTCFKEGSSNKATFEKQISEVYFTNFPIPRDTTDLTTSHGLTTIQLYLSMNSNIYDIPGLNDPSGFYGLQRANNRVLFQEKAIHMSLKAANTPERFISVRAYSQLRNSLMMKRKGVSDGCLIDRFTLYFADTEKQLIDTVKEEFGEEYSLYGYSNCIGREYVYYSNADNTGFRLNKPGRISVVDAFDYFNVFSEYISPKDDLKSITQFPYYSDKTDRIYDEISVYINETFNKTFAVQIDTGSDVISLDYCDAKLFRDNGYALHETEYNGADGFSRGLFTYTGLGYSGTDFESKYVLFLEDSEKFRDTRLIGMSLLKDFSWYFNKGVKELKKKAEFVVCPHNTVMKCSCENEMKKEL